MKKIILILSVILAIFLVSCDKQETFTATDYSVEEVSFSLTTAFSDGIIYQNGTERELDGDFLDYYFGDKELLTDVDSYVFITSPTTEVCEVGVFKVTSANARDTLLKAFATRRDNLIQIHTNYSADDLAVSQNLKTGSFDDVVYFIATSDNASVEALITK